MLIGICDDNAADVNKIRFALADVSPDIELRCFDSGGALLDEVRNGAAFDLVFLDIFLAGENGMETAGTLRERSPETEIVFCTTSRDYAVEAFRVQAADYLVKPCSEQDVVNVFARLMMKRRDQKPNAVLLQSGRELRIFNPGDVMKIESDRHYTRLTAPNGTEQRVHMNYSDVAARFPESFLELRRGLTVNMTHVIGVKGAVVTLTDGSSYTISKSKLDQVIGDYTRYISGV